MYSVSESKGLETLLGEMVLDWLWCVFYLIVALHCINERLICHNLCVSVEKGLETILGLLKLLLGYLWKEE